MKNKNSLKAYFDKDNQRTFNSHKAKIVRELRLRPDQHSRELAVRLRLSNEAIKKRITNLKQEDSIEVSRNIVFNGQTVALYRIKEQLSLFAKEEKPTLKAWLKSNYPEILLKYDALVNHEI